MRQLAESDWKKIKALKDVALDRFCERVLQELQAIIATPGRNSHERYLEVFRCIQERDETLAAVFDDLRRSTTTMTLFGMIEQELVVEAELEELSAELKDQIGVWRGSRS